MKRLTPIAFGLSWVGWFNLLWQFTFTRLWVEATPLAGSPNTSKVDPKYLGVVTAWGLHFAWPFTGWTGPASVPTSDFRSHKLFSHRLHKWEWSGTEWRLT